MAKKFDFELNSDGIKELLNSEEMKNILSEKADEILHLINKNGYEKGDIYSGKNRPNVAVYANTYQAKKDNLKNNTLEKAISRVKSND